MSLHISRFIDRIKAAESRTQREVIMTINEARDLHGDITKLLLLVEELRQPTSSEPSVIEVEVQGGSF